MPINFEPKQIPLAQLMISPKNQRVTPSSEGLETLVASIRELGLIHPLIVGETDIDCTIRGKGKKAARAHFFEIYAGQRRFEALQMIHGNDSSIAIECRVVDANADAQAISLAENYHRQALNLVDEIDAFTRLKSQHGIDQVAQLFGVTTRYIEQRLALYGLPAAVREFMREGKVGIGIASSLTMATPDWILGDWLPAFTSGIYWAGDPQSIRQILRRQRISPKVALFDLKEAGVAVARDLFESDDEGQIFDLSRFATLQEQAMDSLAAKYNDEGWKEVFVIKLSDHQRRNSFHLWQYRQADGAYAAEVELRIAKIESEIEELAGQEDLTAADEEKTEDRIFALQEELEALQENGERIFDEAARARLNVILFQNADYGVTTHVGMEHDDDREAREAAEHRETQAALKEAGLVDADGVVHDDKPMGEAHPPEPPRVAPELDKGNLSAQHLQLQQALGSAAQAGVAGDLRLALVAAICEFATTQTRQMMAPLSFGTGESDRWLGQRTMRSLMNAAFNEIFPGHDHAIAPKKLRCTKTPPHSFYLGHESEGELALELMLLDDDDLQLIFRIYAALRIGCGASPNKRDMTYWQSSNSYKALDITAFWQPTPEFFSWMTKPGLLALLDEWQPVYENDRGMKVFDRNGKKDELIEAAMRFCPKGWLPHYARPSDYQPPTQRRWVYGVDGPEELPTGAGADAPPAAAKKTRAKKEINDAGHLPEAAG